MIWPQQNKTLEIHMHISCGMQAQQYISHTGKIVSTLKYLGEYSALWLLMTQC